LKKLQVTNFNFCQALLRPRQTGAHGTSHACHTLDTPLMSPLISVVKNVFSNKKGLADI